MPIGKFFKGVLRSLRTMKPAPELAPESSEEPDQKPRLPIGMAFRGRPKGTGGPFGGKPIGREDAEGFVYEGHPLFVFSSNVGMVQYFDEYQHLVVEFLDGSAYMYMGVTAAEMIWFLRADSKGVWIWDRIRVRGSATAHRKQFKKIR